MRKKLLVIVATFIVVLGCSMTACAEPKTMEDGTVFDAEYYAQQYPDVVAALGSEEAVLYQHFVTYGKAEGRLPYSPEAEQVVSEVPVVSTETPSVETYNEYPKIYGQQYFLHLCSKSSDVIQSIPSIWAGTPDALIEAFRAGIFHSEEYLVEFPETGYGSYYYKYYNYTVTGKVTSYYKYSATANSPAYTALFLENSYGIEFRLEVSPDTPFQVGETITIKGWTHWFGDNIDKYGVHLRCSATNNPLYEW